MTTDQINNNFTYHAPTQGQLEKYEFLRLKFRELAILVNNLCPESREKAIAFTKLEEAVLWTNTSIARNP